MSYLVLARKWRPQTFEAITGQEHVTRTLTQAIEQDRVHHAFLFCGARGVGKTTAARVLARALNCDNGPTPTPCGECKPCIEIAAGTAVDVFEIDGASNRGIGEIRELREGIAYAPQRDRYKLYIIDEVHMLTTEAFNALLKTLEEPPAHVKFIFATTEPQKIPVTILSRCQRFDFKRIPLGVMAGRLAEILAAEGVTMAEAALRLVARESEGSMRDALSLLDRIISFCGSEADFEQVASVLGVADRSWLRTMVDAALSHDAPAALAVVQDVFNYGIDLRQFASDLVHYLRDIIVLQVAGGQGGLTDLADEETNTLTQLGQRWQVEDLERLFQIAARVAERLSQAAFPRLEMEMAAIRLCRVKPLVPINGLIDRLGAIERALTSGAPLPPPSTPTPPGGGPGPGAGRDTAPRSGASGAHAATAAPAPAPAPAAPPVQAQAQAQPQPQAQLEPQPRPQPQIHSLTPAPALRLVPEPATPEPASEVAPAPAPEPEPATATVAPAPPEPEPEPAAEPRPLAGDAPATFDSAGWEAFVATMQAESPALGAVLMHAQVSAYDDAGLRISFASGGFNVRSAVERHAEILAALHVHVGAITGLVIEDAGTGGNSPFEKREQRKRAALDARREAIAHSAAVRLVVERFDGNLSRVELYEQETKP